MKVTIFNGSPKGKKGNTAVMTKYLTEGFLKAGAEVEEIELVDKRIEYCKGCFGCWNVTPGKCVIKDDMTKMMEKYIESDYVVFATPVYYYTMTGIMKNFVDRLLPLVDQNIEKDESGFYKHKSRGYKLPKTLVVSSAGFPGEGNFEGMKVAFKFLNPVEYIFRNQGGILGAGEAVKQMVESYGDGLRRAGEELILKGKIEEATHVEISKLFIPDEIYTEMANAHW